MGVIKGTKRGDYKIKSRDGKKNKLKFSCRYTQKEFDEITKMIEKLKEKRFKTRDILLFSIRNFYKINLKK